MSIQCYDFGSVVRLQETCEEYLKYLHNTECNGEPLEFVLQVETYQQFVIQTFRNGIFWSLEMQEEYLRLFCDYIQMGGKHELNLSFFTRTAVTFSVQEMNLFYETRLVSSMEQLKIKLFHIFDEATQFIFAQLQMDSFSRFVRTNRWKHFCQTHKELHSKLLRSLQLIPLFTTAEFLDPLPHAREIQIAKYFILDSNQWILETTLPYTYKHYTEKINFYRLEPRSIVVSQDKELTSAKCYKFSYWFPFSYKKFMCAYFNQEFWKLTGTEFKHVKIVVPSQNQSTLHQPFAYARTFFTYRPVFQTQEFLCNIVFINYRNEQGKKTIMMIMRTVMDDSYPKEHPNNVRVIAFTVLCATKIDNDSCRVVAATYLNVKGLMQKIMNFAIGVLRRVIARDVVKNATALDSKKSFDDNLGFEHILAFNKQKTS